MAIAVVDISRGNNNTKTAGTSLVIDAGATGPLEAMSAGNYAIVWVACDNIATAAGASTNITVADSQGNTYIRDREHTQSAGAANDGVTAGIFRAKLTNPLGTSDSITATFSASIAARCMAVSEVSVAAGKDLSVAGSSATPAAASTSYSETVGSLASESHLWLGMPAAEEELGTAVTKDASYTNGPSGLSTGTGGVNDSNIIATGAGYLIETGTTQTFDNTSLTSCDRVTLLVAYNETESPTARLTTFRHRRIRTG